MRFPLSLTALFVSISLMATAQSDTVLVYTPSSQFLDTILPVAFDTTLVSGHTGSYVGSEMGEVTLDNTVPVQDLMTGANHTNLQLASASFNVADHPVRTAVKLARWVADTLQHVCSGIMVSPSYVLTASHCILNVQSGQFYDDGLVAFPGFDHGAENASIPASNVQRIFTFKKYLDGASTHDMALLELADPIGLQSGWVGVGFESDDFIESNIFHKFSYPGQPFPGLDSLQNFNGDTLFYDYGEMSVLAPFVGVSSPDAYGRVGQSGSSMVYSNGTEIYSLGVLVWSTSYRHSRMTNSKFHQLQNILDQDVQVGVKEQEDLEFTAYPNPTAGRFTINLKGDRNTIKVLVSNALGEKVNAKSIISPGQIEIDIQGSEGLYFVEVFTDTGRAILKVMKH